MIRFVFYLLLMAAVLYGIFWAIDRRNAGGGTRGPGSGGPGPVRPRPRGPMGPDDDDAFLRDLEQERRRSKHANPPTPPAANPRPPTSQETHDQPE
ncbi:MAG: hypothetical protein ACJ72E_01925 [Marmoricola sp.]